MILRKMLSEINDTDRKEKERGNRQQGMKRPRIIEIDNRGCTTKGCPLISLAQEGLPGEMER
jgi:hypothetical protein